MKDAIIIGARCAGSQRSLDLAPALAATLRRGGRARHYVGTGDLPNYFRKPYGPGWALAGDAGRHRDPCGGYGISDAFRDADRLAEAVDAGLSQRRPLEAALADYERERNREAMPLYEQNYAMASLKPAPPHVRTLHQALETDQDAADRFTGAVLGTVPVPQFFSQENIERIIGRHRAAVRGVSAVHASS